MDDVVDIAVIGAGAAGLFAATWAGRTLPASAGAPSGDPGVVRCRRVIVLDGAAKIGAKILVAGGGRCNVTHDVVDESAFAGASPHAVKKVLRQFGVEQTVEFFRERGVELKREETGKLFPVTDDAKTVLDALVSAAMSAGVDVVYPWRVRGVWRDAKWFVVEREAAGGGAAEALRAKRVVLATGGMSLPKTGSDGAGYEIAKSLGHTLTPRVFPALVPLMLEKGHWLTGLSGITLDATFAVQNGVGKRLVEFTGSTLLTHVGLSGPAVLDISRHYTAAKAGDTGASLVVNWLPGETATTLRAVMEQRGASTVGKFLSGRLPERLGRAIAEQAGVEAGATVRSLTRERRMALCLTACEYQLPIVGDRGWLFAEVTAGGVPLTEVRLATMESRLCPGLHLCGEVLDVDGRIGGYNFQWAWASGYVAGRGAARLVSGQASAE